MTGLQQPPHCFPQDLVARGRVYGFAQRGSESGYLKLHEPEQSLRFENNGNENDTMNKVPRPPTKGQPNRLQQYT